ncbi:MAG: OsmC family protein [Humibacillus sp.]|nr:OsmC family protein [Humibacillus sp.]MDN5776150.1 OsmC family protein [Humibacillus sp.]
MSDHIYTTTLLWSGSTGEGLRAYTRTHRATAPPATAPVELSADPRFRGDGDLLNPEQLLVMAASSCQLLAFLAVATRDHVDVVHYEDAAVGTMSDGEGPMSIETIRLTPTIQVAAGTDHELVARRVHEGHEGCFIANSLKTEVTVEATVVDVQP